MQIEDDLDRRFTREAIDAANSVQRAGLPRRGRWLSAIAEHGSARAAWRAQSDTYSSGFADLCLARLPHLTVEYQLLSRRFADLFTEAERDYAARSLREHCGDWLELSLDADGFVNEPDVGK